MTFAVWFAVWASASLILLATDDTILVPSVVLAGSFLVPASLAAFALSRERAGYVTTEELVLGFLLSGTVGLAATALLETYALPAFPLGYAGIAVFEEGGKALVLLVAARGLRRREPRDGMVLGAVVGAGFAALESAGYAMDHMYRGAGDQRIHEVLRTVVVRAALAPGGHIVWTALLGGALFAAFRHGRLRGAPALAATLVGVCGLHAAWNLSADVAVAVAKVATGDGWHLIWSADPNVIAQGQRESVLRWFTLAYTGLLALNMTAGLLWTAGRWRRYAPARARPPEPVSDGAARR